MELRILRSDNKHKSNYYLLTLSGATQWPLGSRFLLSLKNR